MAADKPELLMVSSKTHYTFKKLVLLTFLIINLIVYILHIEAPYFHYFCQLTAFGQILVISNFIWALTHNINQPFSKRFSRYHILTFSIQTVIVIGFWGLRVFFRKGIIPEGEKRDMMVEVLSMWVHGGGFVSLFIIGKVCKLQLQFKLWIKLVLHLAWAIPYILIQYGYFLETGEHIYGFLEHFEWKMLIAFQATLYVISVLSDYFLTFILEHKKMEEKKQKEDMKKHNRQMEEGSMNSKNKKNK